MIIFNLGKLSESDRIALQERLDWVSGDTANSPDWVWLAALNKLEVDCGLTQGTISVDSFPKLGEKGQKLTVEELEERHARILA